MPLPPERQIDIIIAEPFEGAVSEDWLRRVAQRALDVALPPGAGGQVSLVITDDATVRQLNREYRGLDEVTDVLSFSSAFAGHWEGDEDAPQDRLTTEDAAAFPFPFPEDELPPLGEVIISYPQTQRQAAERGEPVERELALLVVHGVLHLMGHDHLEPEETAAMQAKERQALAAIFGAGAAAP